MKNTIPYIIIAVLIILLWQKSCTGKDEPVVINVPEKRGSFPEVFNPDPIVIDRPYEVIKWKTETIEVQNPVNRELIIAYQLATDSLQRLKLYAEAIGEQDYHIPYEDSLIKTDSYIKSQGKVLSFKQDYIIKEQKIPYRPKETVLRLLGGFEAGNTIQLNGFSAKANIMLQNRKGNILSAGYDTNERIWIGYNFSIFNIRK